jgi:hypothetical protein
MPLNLWTRKNWPAREPANCNLQALSLSRLKASIFVHAGFAQAQKQATLVQNPNRQKHVSQQLRNLDFSLNRMV